MIRRVLEEADIWRHVVEGAEDGYSITEDGVFQVSFTTKSGLSWVMAIGISGEQSDVYKMESSSELYIPRGNWGSASMFCNLWNRDNRWPRAHLYVQDPNTDAGGDLLTDYQIYCGAGVHQELLDWITFHFLFSSDRFWERAHQELGCADGTVVSAANELQSAHGGEPPAAIAEELVAEEPPSMPQGPITYTGRYPGYEPAQAMAAFRSVRDTGQPPYQELRDYWVSVFDEVKYGLVAGCFVEPDGTPVVVVTGFCEPEYSNKIAELLLGEYSALQQSAQSMKSVSADEEITESGEYGTLRQLRPSELDGGFITPSQEPETPAQGSDDSSPSASPSSPDPARREVTISELHRTITQALDLLGFSYHWSEEGGTYGVAHEGVVLFVAARDAEGDVPAAVLIQAVVLEKVECTKELALDLLERSSRMMFAAWFIDDESSITGKRQPDGMVKVTLGYDLRAEQLDVELVRNTIGGVLNTALSDVGELQTAHGGERPASVAEELVAEEPPEPPTMPRGPFTYTGRYPGYEPAQAMAAFFSVSCEHKRPSYEKRRDGWVFDGGGYWIVVGCFVEPDGTPLIALTCVCESDDGIRRSHKLFMGEFFTAMRKSAHSTTAVLPDEEITESGEHGTLRQLRPSEVGPIPDSASEAPAEKDGSSPRFDGLYYAEGSSYHSYLRFYEDGTVLQVSTNGKPEQVARWLGKAHREVPRGTYAFQGLNIEFSTGSSEGTVVYKGRVFDDAVELSSHSYMNGHEDQATYSFVQVALH